MKLVKRKPIIIAVIICAGIFLIVRSARVLRNISVSTETADRITLPTQLQHRQSVEPNPGEVDGFVKFWNEFVQQVYSSSLDQSADWFKQWQSKQIGKNIKGHAVYRGAITIPDERKMASGFASLIFRPFDERLRRTLRIKCSVQKDDDLINSLSVDKHVFLEGEIKSIVRNPGLSSNTLPYGSVLTVTLTNVRVKELNNDLK